MHLGPRQTFSMELFTKIVSNVNIKPLTILEKRFTLGAWMGPECASSYVYNTVLKI